jgi:hypothetical protein
MRKQSSKTEKIRHVAAGRAELRRDGASNDELGKLYGCHRQTINELTKLFQDNHDDFRKIAIHEAEEDYKKRGIHVSAHSVRAYLVSRKRKYGGFDFESAEPVSLRSLEKRFEVAFRKFEGVTLEYERLQNIISGGIRGIAKQDFQPTVEASKVASALQAMHDALDQLDPRPVDQIGTAPPDFHEIVSPVFKHREFWIPNSIWCNLNNGRHSR